MKSSFKKFKNCLVIIFIAMAVLAGTITSYAQTIKVTPEIQAQINTELQKRGLTESEVQARLLQNGIDPQNIPVQELPNYKNRVIAILDKMEAEKKNASVQPININVGSSNSGATELTPTAVNAPEVAVAPITTPQEAAAEASQRVIQAEAAKEENSNIYGHSMFTDHTLDVFRTTDGAQAPDTYVLGDGDEIRISIFGASQTDIQQKIALDGSIQPSGVAKVFLKGLTLAQAREVIQQRLSKTYTFRSDQFAVTIVTARTLMVTVFGEAKITGGFNLSALNSAINALSAAGGPTSIGSVRAIQHLRGTTRKYIDLYTFMNDPTTQFKFDLQNNDILFVPVAKIIVSIQGAVKRPMRYEMLPNESLIDLINYAGDVNKDAFPDFVQIQRYINGEPRLFEYKLDEVRSKKIKVELINGDIVRIKSIGKPLDQYVDIDGSVYYPGRYDLNSNGKISSLLRNAKFTVQAKTDLLFVERIRSDNTVEQISVKWNELLNSGEDFTLLPRDKVHVTEQARFRDIAPISVNGQVRSPFEKSFSIDDRITVKRAIELAGGLKSTAYPVAYIFRRNIYNPVEMQYIRVELDKADNLELQPGDQLNVYDNSTYTNVGEVRIFGAVKNPRELTYDPTLTVTDVINNAGGFNVGAAFNRVEIFRTNLSPTEKSKLELITLNVDSTYHIISPQNFALQPYDQIVVRMTPEFTLNRTVEITGQVKYPGTYVLESKETPLSKVIKMAGGLLNGADPNGVKLFRTYGNRGLISFNLKKALTHPRNKSYNPILFEGDVINVKRLENTVTIRETGTRMAQYALNTDYSSSKNVVYQGSKSAGWYVRHFAGGFDKETDLNSVTVLLPNNQLESTNKFLFFRSYPKVVPGSTITMQMKPPKTEEKEKKPVDWNAIWSTTTAAITSFATLYLLFDRISPSSSN